MEQLRLEFGATHPAPNPNARFFGPDGEPRRLLWCSDSARMGGPCPYLGDKERFMPRGGCCKDLVERRKDSLADPH